MILLALLEDPNGVTVPHDDGPMIYVSSDLIGWVRGVSVDSGPGAMLLGRDGETLGYIRRTPRELAKLINGFDEPPEA